MAEAQQRSPLRGRPDAQRPPLPGGPLAGQRRLGPFIGGKARPCGRLASEIIDPATELSLAEVAECGAVEIGQAVRAARRALTRGPWPRLRALERGRLLYRLADLIQAHGETLATLETLQNGIGVDHVRQVEIRQAVAFVRHMAERSARLERSRPAHEPAPASGIPRVEFNQREPAGVVAGIVPIDSSLTAALWCLAPALASGCTVVLKPSRKSPLCALHLAQLAMEAGFPPGVLNTVTGSGEITGTALVRHRGIDRIRFVGSAQAARRVLRDAAQNLVRCSTEVHGCRPILVFADADLESAAASVARAVFSHRGPSAGVRARLFVHHRVYGEFTDRLCALAARMRVGSGFDPRAEVGPLASRQRLDSVLRALERAVGQGATIATGGRRARDGGFFLQPTVLLCGARQSPDSGEDLFLPAVGLHPFARAEEAVRQANAAGGAGSVTLWCASRKTVRALLPQLRARTVWVNCPDRVRPFAAADGTPEKVSWPDTATLAVESCTRRKNVCLAGV